MEQNVTKQMNEYVLTLKVKSRGFKKPRKHVCKQQKTQMQNLAMEVNGCNSEPP